MPGYILHLTAAKMYLDLLPSGDPLRIDPEKRNEFYIGNLLPDTVKEKSASHFRDPRYRDRFMEWPHLKRFLDKYRERLSEPAYRGYGLHLYIDRWFFRDYIPKAAAFYDSAGRETEQRAGISCVLVRKSGERIPVSRYLSEEYYYGDYTKMNTWLCERYDLPEALEPGRDPEIGEADFSRVGKILREIKEYRKIPADAVRGLKVFDAEELTEAMEKAVALLFPLPGDKI